MSRHARAAAMSFAWHLIWRSVTRPEAARAEERLLDLGPARWRRGDVSVSSAPGDAVHAVSVDGGGPRAGTALVMVHGLGTGSGIFFKNVGPLAASFGALHSVDWRGAGLSGRPAFPGDQPHDLARDFLVDGLNEWTRQHGVEKMVLLGHSMGGLVAAHFADRYPERVEHLVLVGPAGVGARRSRFQKGDSWAYPRPRRNPPSRRGPSLAVAASAEYPRPGRGAAAARLLRGRTRTS